MTTLPPIQPRPILCKTSSGNNATNSPSVFLIHSGQSATINNANFYASNSDSVHMNHNNTPQIPSVSIPSAPLSSYEEFLKRLREFHRCRQTSFRFLPTIAGQVIDLQALYNTVVAHGGWDKVNDRQLWPTIASSFGIDSSCLNGTQALKNIYIRYLYAFEKISNGENIDSYDDEDEDSKRRTISQLQRVPQSYNHAQHAVPDSLRAQYGLFRDFVRRNEYEKLELALLCGFPNELTFTLNTLLLLSSSTNNSNPFHLEKCPRLLDILYRHIGLFLSTDTPINDHYLKILYDDIWSKHLNYSMDSFWIDFVCPAIVKQLLNIDLNDSETNLYKNFNTTNNENQQQQELRIEQIVMILRNLSFDRTNALYLIETMRSSPSMTYVFLLLLSYCEKKTELQKYAYDVWANLSLFIQIRSLVDDEGRLFRQMLHYMLNTNQIFDDDDEQQQQEDRLKIIRGLEIISHLAQSSNDNGIYLLDYIDIMVTRLIHVSDILVLVHTLECLYQLSDLGEQLCNAILKVQSSTSIIMTLIDLLTIEARSFSSQTIKTIKIVEMSSGPVLLPSYSQPTTVLTQQQPNPSQSVVVISTSQLQSQQAQAHQQTYAIENTEINRNYYSSTNKLVVQQQTKPMTVASVIASGNLLTVATSNSSNNQIIVANPNSSNNTNHVHNNINIHSNNNNNNNINSNNTNTENKRKHDSISETIAAVVNGTSSPVPTSTTPPPAQKRARPARPTQTPTKNTVIVAPTPATSSSLSSRLVPSSSVEEDTSSMESNSTSNSVHSTIADLLDRCSSPPSTIDTFEHEIRSCLTDLCHRVALMLDDSMRSNAIIYNPVPSPVFKRKVEEQSPSNRRNKANKTTESNTNSEEQTAKKKRNRSSVKKSTIDTSNVIVAAEKKEEPIEHETIDVKPTASIANVVTSPMPGQTYDYMCEWDNCRKTLLTARAVFHHACSAHVKHSPDYVCLWHGCDRLRRQKWALISHIQERHCSEAAFRQARLKSANTVTTVAANNNGIITNPQATTIGYAPDAAWLAVRRHMQMNSFEDLLTKTKEGPLTKSIRLTAALILRNIARHSSIGKQNLRQYEQLIANLALESSEASNTLSSCLFELYN